MAEEVAVEDVEAMTESALDLPEEDTRVEDVVVEDAVAVVEDMEEDEVVVDAVAVVVVMTAAVADHEVASLTNWLPKKPSLRQFPSLLSSPRR